MSKFVSTARTVLRVAYFRGRKTPILFYKWLSDHDKCDGARTFHENYVHGNRLLLDVILTALLSFHTYAITCCIVEFSPAVSDQDIGDEIPEPPESMLPLAHRLLSCFNASN